MDIVHRTGGRSARVRRAVLQAASELLDERGLGRVGIQEIAERSGVHATSLYRRWGTLSALLLDAAVERVAIESPLPDEGSLRGDLVSYAAQVTDDLFSPGGMRLLQAVVAAADTAGTARGEHDDMRRVYLNRRTQQLQQMLDRDAARGEPTLHWSAVVDGILAPLYLRRLFGVEVGPGLADILADRVLGTIPAPEA